MISQRTALMLCVMAMAYLVGTATPALAAVPSAVPVDDTGAVVGTVISVEAHKASGGDTIVTDVVALDGGQVTSFSMPGGELGGMGLWTEEYTELEVGDAIYVELATATDGSVEVAEAPVVLSSVTAQAVSDYLYEGVRWDYAALPVHWRFNTSGAPAGAIAAIQASAQTWEDDAYSTIDFTYDGTTGASPEADDDANTVGFSEYIVGGELAHCRVWYELTQDTLGYDRIVEFDIDLNTYYSWSTSPNPSQYDIQSVALHEFGHTLHLADLHNNTPGAASQIMNGYTASGTTPRTLAEGDLAGLREIYPSAGPADTVAPTVGCDAVGAYTGPATIQITASDADSGVARIEWSLNSGSTTTVYGSSATVRINSSGSYTLNYAAVDVAGNRATGSASFTVTVPDTSPPVTSASGIPSWSNNDVVVALFASDSGGSGVNSTFYRIGSGPSTLYSVPFTVSTSGVTAVQFWSVDHAGNTEPVRSTEVRIDRTLPSVSSNGAGTFTGSASITITGADALSGVASVGYSLDGGAWQTVLGSSASVNVSAVGVHTLTCYAMDRAGNRAEVTSTFTVVSSDMVAPVTTVFGVPATWVSTDVTLTLSATDSDSGLSGSYYRIGTGPALTYTGPFVLTGNGQFTVGYWSVDHAGNTEAEKTVDVRIDRVVPSLSAIAGGVFHAPVIVSASAVDTESGVALTGYSIDGGGWMTLPSAEVEFELTARGPHSVRVFAEDAAGNRTEATATISVVVSAKLTRTPSGRTYTVRRHSGVARWTTSAVLKTDAGAPMARKRVVLQKRVGSGRWTTYATLTSSATGRVTKRVTFRSRGTTQWRWYAKGDGASFTTAYSTVARVTVK